VRIVDEQRHSLPPGAVGEILVRSDSLFDGYFHRPDLTARVLEEGWYCTGDLGFLLHDELFVVGRRKDLLIIGGENIYPQDIEELVSAHPAIHDGRAVALGFFNRDLGTEDLAVVAEVNDQVSVAQKKSIEREIRASVLAQLNVAIRYMFLKPPMWIDKSTAGKPARSGTREKLQQEHPELPACL
jgi:acyl-CoA synthetase (AMP-forming)/AMP-acid ligase II